MTKGVAATEEVEVAIDDKTAEEDVETDKDATVVEDATAEDVEEVTILKTGRGARLRVETTAMF